MDKAAMDKIAKRMLWIIPSMLLFMLGDYYIGLEPTDSVAVSGMISSGWLTISDWRIAVSNIGGAIGTVFYSIAAVSFVQFLSYRLTELEDKPDRRILKVYMAGLIAGCAIFMYFHLACGTLIHSYNAIYEAAGGNVELAVKAWNRVYAVQCVPYWASFAVICVMGTGGWIAVIIRQIIPLKKAWILAAPLAAAAIGFALEALIPWPFNGFSSGFESCGWMVMFLGGREYVRRRAAAL